MDTVRNRRWNFFLVGLWLLAASALEADPRWWRDECGFLPPGEDGRDPHLSGHVDELRDDAGLFLVYAERDPAGGRSLVPRVPALPQGLLLAKRVLG